MIYIGIITHILMSKVQEVWFFYNQNHFGLRKFSTSLIHILFQVQREFTRFSRYMGTMWRLVQIETWFFEIIHCIPF